MDRYQEIKDYVNDLIKDIEKMKYYQNKISCLFSIVDSFVQNYFNYSSYNNQKKFKEFILKFADKEKYNYLELIEPITLIYDKNNKKIRFEELSDANIYVPNSSSIENIRQRNEVLTANNVLKEKHKYISLIYCTRSKLVHEHQSSGIIGVDTENYDTTPIYLDCTSYWSLLFPYTFLKELFLNCIENYLKYQKENGQDPFNNNFGRKSHYAFYD